jgi:gliding motility-associated lipoprotein GldD
MKRLLLLILVCAAACRPSESVPKPRGYARIDLPAKHEYQRFEDPRFPFSFELPLYGHTIQDSSLLREHPENPYWLNVEFPSLGASIYLSYNQIRNASDLGKLLEDAHFMSYYHSKRADYVKDKSFRNEFGVSGAAYEWGGASASSYQFIATDSIHNFLRGALYFNVTPNADSLKPAAEFLQADVEHMMKTVRFRQSGTPHQVVNSQPE